MSQYTGAKPRRKKYRNTFNPIRRLHIIDNAITKIEEQILKLFEDRKLFWGELKEDYEMYRVQLFNMRQRGLGLEAVLRKKSDDQERLEE